MLRSAHICSCSGRARASKVLSSFIEGAGGVGMACLATSLELLLMSASDERVDFFFLLAQLVQRETRSGVRLIRALPRRIPASARSRQ